MFLLKNIDLCRKIYTASFTITIILDNDGHPLVKKNLAPLMMQLGPPLVLNHLFITLFLLCTVNINL